jgi:hypothetical protein
VFGVVPQQSLAPVGRPADEPIRGVGGEVRHRHPEARDRVAGPRRLVVEVEPIRSDGTELRE